MFKRRNPLTFLYKAREFFYPRMGWRRAIKYFKHRTFRLPVSANSLAKGLACGAAVSFTPFVGFHFLIAFMLCWLMGGNLFAAAVGTVIGNPLTFFFIWLGTYKVGSFLLSREAAPDTIEKFTATITQTPYGFFQKLPELYEPVLYPMLIGSIPFVIVIWTIVFFVSRPLIVEYRLIYRLRRRKKFRKQQQL